MKKVIIPKLTKATIGGIFHQDTLIYHESIEEAILNDVPIYREHQLQRIVDYCEMLLDEELTPQEREKYWVRTVGEEWLFTHEGMIILLEFMRDEMRKELSRRAL